MKTPNSLLSFKRRKMRKLNPVVTLCPTTPTHHCRPCRAQRSFHRGRRRGVYCQSCLVSHIRSLNKATVAIPSRAITPKVMVDTHSQVTAHPQLATEVILLKAMADIHLKAMRRNHRGEPVED